MFHPETQNRHVVGIENAGAKSKLNDERTEEINFYFSEHLRRQGAKNMDTHCFADPAFGERMEWLNANIGLTRDSPGTYAPALGF